MHLRLNIFLTGCACLILTASAEAGVILNTLDGFENREPGWSGQVEGLFSGAGGNTERVLFSAGGQVQRRGEVDTWRLQATASYEESDNAVTARDMVVHLRQNHDLGPDWASILFAQVQYNPFQRLESRWLLGIGARRDLYRGENGHISAGVTPMLEIERIEGAEAHTSRGRLSVFLILVQNLGEHARMDMHGFWQPLMNDFDAWRTTANVALVVEVTGWLDFKTGVAVEDDARPPAGVKRTDWSTYAGLTWGF